MRTGRAEGVLGLVIESLSAIVWYVMDVNVSFKGTVPFCRCERFSCSMQSAASVPFNSDDDDDDIPRSSPREGSSME